MSESAWQSAWVEVLPDFSNFRDRAVPGITQHLSTAGDKGSQAFGASFASGIRGVGGAVIGGAVATLGLSMVQNLTSMIGDGIRAGLDWVSEGVDLASDLSESVNAVQRSYEGAAEGIFALGENSADALALTRAELNSAAVQFASFSKTIAGDGGDAADVFKSIAERGVDFASVMNVEVSDALAKFQSGLAGETEPLRQYGIDLSAAAVANYAVANGIAASAGEMTEAQKVQARYGLLMQQTDKFAGDFAATSDGLANSQRRLNASLAEVQTSAGEIFLPIVTELANVANDKLVPALRDVVQESGPELAASLAESVPSLVDFLEAVIPLLPQLVELGITALPFMIRSGETLIPILSWLTENTTGWWTAVGQLFALLAGDQSVRGFIKALEDTGGTFGWLIDVAASAGTALGTFAFNVRTFATNAATWLSQKITDMVGFIQSLPQRAAEAIGNVGNYLYSSGRALIQGFINGISSMFKPVGDAVSGVLNWAAGFFPHSPAERGPFSGSGWYDLPNSGAALFEQWASGFENAAIAPALSPSLAAMAPAVVGVAANGGSFATSGTSFDGPQRVTLVVDGYEFNAYVRDQADSAAETRHRRAYGDVGRDVAEF